MRIIFIGTVDFSYHCLEHLLKKGEKVVAIFTKQADGKNSDHRDLAPLADKYQIPLHYVENINDPQTVQLISSYSIDIIFCFGWSQIIKSSILNLPPKGVVGVHPAKLPENRGRHPLIWALVLGLTKSALTFFRMNQGADTGDIFSQRDFVITYKDDAASLYKKIKVLALKQMDEFLPLLKNGKIRLSKQNEKQGNAWRKRGFLDGQIDWRMSKSAIYNLVRALTHPYAGAHCIYQGQPIRVLKVKELSFKRNNIEPGKVLSIKGRIITIKVSDGAISLVQHEFHSLPKKGEYL